MNRPGTLPAGGLAWLALLLLGSLLADTPASARRHHRRRDHRRAPSGPVFAPGTATHGLKPLGSIGMPARRAAQITARLARQMRSVPGVKLAPLGPVRRFLRSRKGATLAVCEAELGCLYDLGKALGVPLLVSGDLSGLGKGYVLFLRLVDPKARKVVRKLSVVYDGRAAQEDRVLREAAFRLLAPHRFRGKLGLQVDVPGAAVYLNGRALGKAPLAVHSVAAGTHALRVTHPAYHDFVRFIRVPFDKTVTVKVVLKRFPIIAEELRAKHHRAVARRPGSPAREIHYRPLPWYKRWWFVTSVGVVLLAATVTTVALVQKQHLDRDGSVVLDPPATDAQALPVLLRFR